MSIQFFSILLVLVGAVFMTASALAGRKLKKEVPADVRNKWELAASFIFFFLCGYLAFIVILFLDLKFPLEFLTACIFLGGSLFVFLIISLAKFTILRMKTGEKEIEQVNLELQAKNNALEKEILERIQAESSLQESEERYRDLFENAGDLIEILDPEGKYIFVNRSWREAFGYSPEEIANLSIHDLIAPDCVEECSRIFRKILTEGKADRIKTVFVAKNGARIMIEGNADCKFKDGKPSQIRCISRDVTEQKMLEAQLLQAQKMEAVGRLTGGVAHDFNNLLSTILGYGEITLRKLGPDSPVAGNIKLIVEAGQRAGNLTRQLLAFSRKQILEMKVINLEAIIENMVKMFNRLLATNIRLEIILSPTKHNIKADPGQVEQVLMNLVVNAKDAMPRGGVLTIETGAVVIGPEDVSARGGLPPGCYVSMTVGDSGEGMKPEVISHVFDPFYTTKAPDRGTGLGLSTVYGIIKQHHGHISVVSEPGKGSRFTVLFPEITEGVHAEAPMKRAGAWGGNEKILVVDDDPDIIRLVDEALTSLGYRIVVASSAQEGLKISETMGGEIDLILTDVVMPDMSGFEMADEIKKRYPAMKVMIMSGYTEDVLALHGPLRPGIAFISKPIFPSKLTAKIRELLNCPGPR